MRKLNIGILGTRGIPNHYGGFEYAAEKISAGLALRGHEMTVYNSDKHPYRGDRWNGVRIIRCADPENKVGTIGQFVYDFNCIRDARRRGYDIILMMGYTSSSVWGKWFPRDGIVISNMDGLEWKREKYSKPLRLFLKVAERLAVRYSDFYIADSIIIRDYLREKYRIDPVYIPYGADAHPLPELQDDAREKYYMLMARMEPENNVETILTGFHHSRSKKNFVVVGNTENRFGKYLVNLFRNESRIRFAGSIFDRGQIGRLFAGTYIYFHGHSVGGTNPSLLQAMANRALIASHENAFNHAVLQDDALYFSSVPDVRDIIEQTSLGSREKDMVSNNLKKICHEFNWDAVVDRYEEFIYGCFEGKKK
ncbi:MAG TPA: DUF1972 domain-containing protein [Puia sp.]|nr:DUF1972 domain-containing protein [Puia sp.]